MADTLENLQRRKESATSLGAVVRTMKAMAASNIGQYEMAVRSLQDYYKTVSLGIFASMPAIAAHTVAKAKTVSDSDITVAVIWGSDQGLAGHFNDTLATYAQQVLKQLPGKKQVWAVGERMVSVLADTELTASKVFSVPGSVDSITNLVNKLLMGIEEFQEGKNAGALYLFHNSPCSGESYQPSGHRLFPLDEKWREELVVTSHWPTKNPPQVLGKQQDVLAALIKEYLFVLLYKSGAESLASENASRLAAMQRAEKNINDMLDDINQRYNRLRQSSIDEELFDVISGFEALRKDYTKASSK